MVKGDEGTAPVVAMSQGSQSYISFFFVEQSIAADKLDSRRWTRGHVESRFLSEAFWDLLLFLESRIKSQGSQKATGETRSGKEICQSHMQGGAHHDIKEEAHHRGPSTGQMAHRQLTPKNAQTAWKPLRASRNADKAVLPETSINKCEVEDIGITIYRYNTYVCVCGRNLAQPWPNQTFTFYVSWSYFYVWFKHLICVFPRVNPERSVDVVKTMSAFCSNYTVFCCCRDR